MDVFLSAVLPVIIVGVAVIVAIMFLKRKTDTQIKENQKASDNQNPQSHNDQSNYMALGMCFGMCLGSVLGSIGVIPISYGVSFGMLIGMILGMLIKKK